MMRQGFVTLAMALLLTGCGGSSDGGSTTSAPASILPTLTPTPSPSASPTPTPTATSTPTQSNVARGCTAQENVTRASSLSILPVSGHVLVIAIGSSSTLGANASTPSATYPAVLQQMLSSQSPTVIFQVLNKGVGGDTMVGTQARIQSDVIDFSPQAVILQVGVNDAISDPTKASLTDFSNRLRTVVVQLKPKMQVVLMNGQHYPNEPASYLAYQTAIQAVSDDQNVPLFDRYGLMKSWIDSGNYQYSDILYSDSFHPNDFTYHCMGAIAADLILHHTVGK